MGCDERVEGVRVRRTERREGVSGGEREGGEGLKGMAS